MDFGLCGFSGLVSRSSCPGDSLRGSMRMYDTSELHIILVVEDTREQRERERESLNQVGTMYAYMARILICGAFSYPWRY